MKRKHLLLATCGALWMVGAAPASAQSASGQTATPTPVPTQDGTAATDPETPDGPSADIVVTGSRTVTNGYSAPTPVTVISGEQLATRQPQSLSQSLNQSPQFRNSASPQSYGTSTAVGASIGASYLNLRGLGAQRTLILLDGHRVTPSSFLGSSDIGLLPEGLISRVDVVTGGASAAYGSDAVAGVVNFGLDKSFVGLKGLAQGGVSERGDAGNYKVGLTAGATVLEGRGHVLLSGEYYQNQGIFSYYGRDWALKSYAVIGNPGVTDANKSPTNPKTLVVPNVRSSSASFGGLITNTALRGTQFLPGGQPAPFTFGSLLTAATMQGGDGVDAFYDIGLQPEQKRGTIFGRFAYDVADGVSAYAQLLYGRDDVRFISGPGFEAGASSQFTIFNDNAYLPNDVRTRLASGNITSFNLGRISRDFGQVTYLSRSTTLQGNVGLTGKLAEGWKFDVYYSHGETRSRSRIINLPNVVNLYRAADAVAGPGGQVVCRSTLANPSDGCVPINLFGDGTPSAASIAYVTGTASALQVTAQDYAGFSVAGDLFDLPGGGLSVAVGGEYRADKSVQTADALSTATVPSNTGIRGFPAALVGKVGLFERGNPQAFYGKTNVKEAFAEVLAPIVKDVTLIHALDLNGAVRVTDYSSSGTVVTWKGGVTYEPFADLRLRATRSRDIRAPSLFELFLNPSPSTQGGPVTDPFNNTVASSIVITVAGNRDLQPEKADTLSYGFVYRPKWIPGLGVSVDYWKVDIKNAIGQLFASTPATNAQLLINQCFAGNTALCGAIHRSGNIITSVDNAYFNIANVTASGVDIEVNYKTSLDALLGPESSLSMRGVASYLDELSSRLPGGLTIDRAGDVGQTGSGSPHWQATFDATLKHGPFSLFVQERFIGGGKLDNTLTASDININKVSKVFYTDATLRYQVGGSSRFELFLTINNLFDRDPPINPRYLSFGTIPTNRALYDVVGRQFTSGARFKF